MFKVRFAAAKDAEGKYLSEKVRIHLIPSLMTLKLTQESPRDYHCKSGALMVGDPKVGPFQVRGKLVPLPDLPKPREPTDLEKIVSRLLKARGRVPPVHKLYIGMLKPGFWAVSA